MAVPPTSHGVPPSLHPVPPTSLALCVGVCAHLCTHMQVFDTAFVTLFHVTAGDPWPDELPMVRGTECTPHRSLTLMRTQTCQAPPLLHHCFGSNNDTRRRDDRHTRTRVHARARTCIRTTGV